ncbi:tubulin beta-4B chain-like [Ptychodera flava]|uniref:tubulin beta-4B chain-like n=1 Tax=Ptychodera flava TaxID=63121 RepID=UPI00396A3A23
MREIVSVQVGQCGNRIGEKFWKYVADEHELDRDGGYIGQQDSDHTGKAGVYFHETSRQYYVPRAVMADLEPSVIDGVKSGCLGRMFRPDNYIIGKEGSGAGNNFIKGYTNGQAELEEEVLDAVRKEVERCDRLQGFQIVHSIGGGTGSGAGALLIEKIRDQYADSILSTFSVVPSSDASGFSSTFIESVNALLSFGCLVQHSNATYCIDNEALDKIVSRARGKNRVYISPKQWYCDVNRLVASTMSGVTACLRFPGQLNTDLRKLATNMVPFPRLHFFMTSFAPMHTPRYLQYQAMTVAELANEMFDPKNIMVSCDPCHGRYITFAAVFRGRISVGDVESQIVQLRNKNHEQFVEWLPDHVQTAVCDIPLPHLEKSVTFLGNNTAIQELFKRILRDTRKLNSKSKPLCRLGRPFKHLYKRPKDRGDRAGGRDESRNRPPTPDDDESYELFHELFEDANENIRDLIGEYQTYQDAPPEVMSDTDSGEEEEEEEEE